MNIVGGLDSFIGGYNKLIQEDILKSLIEKIEDKNFLIINLSNKELKTLSCKAIRILNLVYSYSDKSSFKITPTELNKKLGYKSLSSVSEGISELENIKLLLKGKKEYFVNPFMFWKGNRDDFMDLYVNEIKLSFPVLYIKYYRTVS